VAAAPKQLCAVGFGDLAEDTAFPLDQFAADMGTAWEIVSAANPPPPGRSTSRNGLQEGDHEAQPLAMARADFGRYARAEVGIIRVFVPLVVITKI
jgi:hypothetical protein